MSLVTILGGGPAGAAAAISAIQSGGQVQLIEKSRFPRHKVCGEFLSPEIAPVLDRLGIWNRFLEREPAPIRRFALHFRKSEKQCRLPDAAYGLSRYRFDQLLLGESVRLGAHVTNEAMEPLATPVVIAHGRRAILPRGHRQFGFKAHFSGPANDAVELFFFHGCYVGINCVEGGITNVCGLGPEKFLRARNFDIDNVVNSFPPLAERLRPLTRVFKWLTVGPLEYRNSLREAVPEGHYPAGDALSFVDPFTGSGLLSAITTGKLAGAAAARGTSTLEYLAECRECLEQPFRISSLLRSAIGSGWADLLLPFFPGALLVRWTRPHVS